MNFKIKLEHMWAQYWAHMSPPVREQVDAVQANVTFVDEFTEPGL